MPSYLLPSLGKPSVAGGFATSAAESAHPELWHGLVGAWSPEAGFGSVLLPNRAGNYAHAKLHGRQITQVPGIHGPSMGNWDSGASPLCRATISDAGGGATSGVGANGSQPILDTHRQAFGGGGTLVAWFKTTSTTGFRALLAMSSGAVSVADYWLLRLGNGGSVRHQGEGQNTGAFNLNYTPPTAYSDDKWHMVAGVRRPDGSVELWYDGARVLTSTATTPQASVDDFQVDIGAWQDPAGVLNPYSAGEIGTTMVYGRPLSPGEITKLYRHPLTYLERSRYAFVPTAPATGASLSLYCHAPTSRMAPAPTSVMLDLGRSIYNTKGSNGGAAPNEWVLSSGSEYVLQATGGGDPFLAVSGADPINLKFFEEEVVNVRTTGYQWTLSANGTNEYYLEASGGGAPDVASMWSETNAMHVSENGVEINQEENLAGELLAGYWTYADNDSLGFQTIYIRLSDDTDPDTKADGYVTVRGAWEATAGTVGSLAAGEFAYSGKQIYYRSRSSADVETLTTYTRFGVSSTGTGDNEEWHLASVSWSVDAVLDDAYRYTTDERTGDQIDLTQPDTIRGYSAGWVLPAGTHTITCKAKLPDGTEITQTEQVTVAADTRTVVPVGAGEAVTTLADAVGTNGATANIAYALQDGHVEDISTTQVISGDNARIYHGGTGTRPKLTCTALNSDMIRFSGTGQVVEGIDIEALADLGTLSNNNFCEMQGQQTALVDVQDVTNGAFGATNNRFDNFSSSTGNTQWGGSFCLILNCHVDQTKDYTFTMGSKTFQHSYYAIVFVGGQYGESSNESIIRFTAQAYGCTVNYCLLDFTRDTNPKSTLRLVGQSNGHMANSRGHYSYAVKHLASASNAADLRIGSTTSGKNDIYGTEIVRVEANLIKNVTVSFQKSAFKTAVTGCVIDNEPSVCVGMKSPGGSPWFWNDDVVVVGNTLKRGDTNSFDVILQSNTGTTNIFRANLGAVGTTAQYIYDSIENDFLTTDPSDYTDNVFDADTGTLTFARHRGTGYTLAQWNALSWMGTDQQVSFTLNADYEPSTPTTVATPTSLGMHDDYFGRTRGATSWAGALSEAAPFAFPTPDNYHNADAIDLDLFTGHLPAINNVPQVSLCDTNTRPDAVTCNIGGWQTQSPSGGTNYTSADWDRVTKIFNRRHYLPRVQGDTYEKTYTVTGVTSSDIDVTVRMVFEVDGPHIYAIAQPQVLSDAAPSVHEYTVSAIPNPFDCSIAFNNFNTTSATWDTTEGGSVGTNIGLIIDVVQAAEAPPKGGTLIWSFERGDIAKAFWDVQMFLLPTGSEGRPEGNGNYYTFGENSEYKIRHQGGYEQPTVDSDGTIRCTSWSPAQDQHTQFTIGGNSSKINDPYLLPSPNRYRMHMDFEVSDDATAWTGNVWTVITDIVPAFYNTSGWIGSSEPPIAFHLRPGDNLFRMEVRGAGVGDTDWVHETLFPTSTLSTTLYGRHYLVIEFELDYSGTNSYTAMWLDGKLVGETTLANAKYANTNTGQAIPKIGAYTSSPQGTEILIRSCEFYEVSGQ